MVDFTLDNHIITFFKRLYKKIYILKKNNNDEYLQNKYKCDEFINEMNYIIKIKFKNLNNKQILYINSFKNIFQK